MTMTAELHTFLRSVCVEVGRSVALISPVLFTAALGCAAWVVSDDLGAGVRDRVGGTLVAFISLGAVFLALGMVCDPQRSARDFLRAALLWMPVKPVRSQIPAVLWWLPVIAIAIGGSLAFGLWVDASTPSLLPGEAAAVSLRQESPGGVLLTVVHAAGEEAVFRVLPVGGALVVATFFAKAWVRRVLLTVVAVVSSVCFGLLHQEFGVTNVISAAFSGLVYAAMVVLSRSLWPAVVAHAGFNLLVLALLA